MLSLEQPHKSMFAWPIRWIHMFKHLIISSHLPSHIGLTSTFLGYLVQHISVRQGCVTILSKDTDKGRPHKVNFLLLVPQVTWKWLATSLFPFLYSIKERAENNTSATHKRIGIYLRKAEAIASLDLSDTHSVKNFTNGWVTVHSYYCPLT